MRQLGGQNIKGIESPEPLGATTGILILIPNCLSFSALLFLIFSILSLTLTCNFFFLKENKLVVRVAETSF